VAEDVPLEDCSDSSNVHMEDSLEDEVFDWDPYRLTEPYCNCDSEFRKNMDGKIRHYGLDCQVKHY